MPDSILEPPPHTVPAVFTRALLDWLPWLESLAVEVLTERHMAGLVDAARVKSPYFRLLARDPDALRARTLTDRDIFYNADAGLPRGSKTRTLAAPVKSCVLPKKGTLPHRYRACARARGDAWRIKFDQNFA
jgi:hypothetical protein